MNCAWRERWERVNTCAGAKPEPDMTGQLPIYELEAEIVAELRAQRRLVVQAPTGSGKSTQVPQMLLRHGLLGRGQAVTLQPRRLAARLLAARVARELGVGLGETVGYQIRLETVASAATRIKFVTEGILLRQMVQDPALAGVQAVLFDEFHERHLFGDITLAQALALQETCRPDLLIVVMSATLEAAALERYLAPCAVLRSSGRVFPVELSYLPARLSHPPPVWELAADTFAARVRAGETGDALVFMPGSYEIQQTIEALRHQPESRGFVLLPLHGELASAEQDLAVAQHDRPKVVVATNVAETSLTIEGIRLVIDSGLARIPRYDPQRGINTLLIEKISRAAADQRAGRAGRTAPGHCVRLWSAVEQAERPPHELPEIQRLDLAEVVLTLAGAHVTDLSAFRWLEPPNEFALAHALELLTELGALKPVPGSARGHEITSLGQQMLAFPAHPRYARMLLAAQDYGCVPQACLIAALTQGRDVLRRNTGREVAAFRDEFLGEHATSDFFRLMRAWHYAARDGYSAEACRRAGVNAAAARQVGPLRDQFLRIAREEGLTVEPGRVPDEALQKCILTAFPDRLARRLDQGTLRCELVHGRRGVLARESVVQASPWLVAAEARELEGADRTVQTILSLATAVAPEWLRELFPAEVREVTRVFYDGEARRVRAEATTQFRGLVLATRRGEPPAADAARLLAAEVSAGRLELPRWDHAVEQWLLRLNFLSRSCPELQLPPVTEADRRLLIEQLCQGAVAYKEIKDREVRPLVQSWLSAAQRALLDQHAPERVALPNGRAPKVVYSADGPPHIALRIQELYDVKAVPRIASNRVPVVLHILAPNMRAVQITQDLSGFWREHYPRLKSELQRQYPKHQWR
jgi:ATP-dependent helicase HrpB